MTDQETIDTIVSRLTGAYARADAEIQRRLLEIANDPNRATLRRRLRGLADEVDTLKNSLDIQAAAWIEGQLPRVYGLGAERTARAVGTSIAWNQAHQGALNVVAQETYDLLLSATRHMSDDAKALIRNSTHQQVLDKLTLGRTANETGRILAKDLNANAISAVIYRNGSRHGVRDYSDMVVRTQSALAYNTGTLRQAENDRYGFVVVHDGPDCGWAHHDDGVKADGRVVPIAQAYGNSISHPRCRRNFSVDPRVKTAAQAKAMEESGEWKATETQAASVRQFDQERAARRAGTRSRARTRVARRERREASLAQRKASTTTPTGPTREEIIAQIRTDAAALIGRTAATPAEAVTLAQARQDLGRRIRETAVGPDLQKRIAAAEARVQAHTAELDDLAREFGSTLDMDPSDPRRKGYYDKQDKILADRKAARAAIPDRGQAVLDVLRQVRPMGTDASRINFAKGSSKPGREAVSEAADWFPSDWWEDSHNSKEFKIKWSKTRAYYNHSGPTGTLQIGERNTANALRSVTTHELTHRMEAVRPSIGKAQLQFWRRRTNDGADRRRYSLGGKGEWVSPDEFRDEYIGKDYLWWYRPNAVATQANKFTAVELDTLSHQAVSFHFEILSMGMEGLRFNKVGMWDDEDMMDFIIGTLGGV